MMRWEDERYVRLFTRDTVTWKLLPWQGKALLPLLLRKVDRAGVADVADSSDEGVAALTDMPLEVVEPGLAALIKRGVVVLHDDGRLVFPNFIEAQEAVQTDAARKRASRERARAVRARDDDDPEEKTASPDAAPPSAPVAVSRDVTVPSRNVTEGHATSRDVTPGHSVPSRAVPSRTDHDDLARVGASTQTREAIREAGPPPPPVASQAPTTGLGASDVPTLADRLESALALLPEPTAPGYADALEVVAVSMGCRPDDAARAVEEAVSEAGLAATRAGYVDWEAFEAKVRRYMGGAKKAAAVAGMRAARDTAPGGAPLAPDVAALLKLWANLYATTRRGYGVYTPAPDDALEGAKILEHARAVRSAFGAGGDAASEFAIAEHWMRGYLRDDGNKSYLLEQRHPLRFMLSRVTSYGQPKPARPAPVPAPPDDDDPVDLVPPPPAVLAAMRKIGATVGDADVRRKDTGS